MSTPSAPFEPLHIRGDSITLETDGKVLVLPTGNPDILMDYNEYTLVGRTLPANGTYTIESDMQYLISPWIALYDPTKTEVDFFLFTYKPSKLQYVVSDVVINSAQFQTADEINFTTEDEYNFLVNVTDKYITQLILYQGNGLIYHGQITHPDLTRDTDSDLIPDVFGRHPYHFVTADGESFTTSDEAYFDFSLLFDGSLNKFLQSYGMVI